MTQTITFVTGNKNKLREAQEILGVKLVNLEIDIPELQLFTSEEVALYKAKEAAKIVGGPVIVDDTALHFNAIAGLPGAYIRAFVTRLRPFEIARLLDSYEDKSAYVTCSIGFCAGPNDEVKVITGRVNGKIVHPRGEGGFGFDPIFQPDGYDKTYAELSEEDKNNCSHRGNALRQFKESGILNKYSL
ncbi:non-canonical purine NTP pyrophosphatase, rdgB/HAM1 family protein [Trichomonas vaginalis G3]|uniref:XTP/dITP diphosphatase n=1 Tax=Trichomonas vaginalis (strain ATCC PRA-98 / G3) TaxID=412133 RepID=A2F859_TRIV3|nr:NADH pyrophosphatase protein [Trichomonas vaginalis G3]EAX98879.1 non-canonical purine NTP pyrophosphatase, rdgB/HAM1 family protein [Trichomonas vaginalis G3]KAI5511609.1 NADH pyrophosphatase protein [Trichomonas vaginalis G3]|eukprot:XP_001311809.1 non-canonical purine NTP pyrophosphatase, rdgB/HAM1 family protein [Trichomonas vaginalis G3]